MEEEERKLRYQSPPFWPAVTWVHSSRLNAAAGGVKLWTPPPLTHKYTNKHTLIQAWRSRPLLQVTTRPRYHCQHWSAAAGGGGVQKQDVKWRRRNEKKARRKNIKGEMMEGWRGEKGGVKQWFRPTSVDKIQLKDQWIYMQRSKTMQSFYGYNLKKMHHVNRTGLEFLSTSLKDILLLFRPTCRHESPPDFTNMPEWILLSDFLARAGP